MIKCTLLTVIIILSLLLMLLDGNEVINLLEGDSKLYTSSLQTSLLGGFLAIAGFLLSTKTFIIVHMKNEVFDSDDWRKEDLRLRNGFGRKSSYYNSLEQLCEFLGMSVFVSLAAACIHLIVVFFENIYTVTLALSLTISSIILVSISWFLISHNLKSWFIMLNKKETQRIRKSQNK